MKNYILLLFAFICMQSTYAIIDIDPDPVTGNGTVVNGPSTPPPNCVGSQPAGNTCQQSSYICDLNGYCGNTSPNYTADYWTQLEETFVGSIENNSFITFTAGAATVSFNLWVYSCTINQGIQFMVFTANDCAGTVVNQLSWSPGLVPTTSQIVTINGLTAGQDYYIMVDGYNGDVCNYAITTNTSSNILVPPTIASSATTICLGEQITLTATGGNGVYNWIEGNGIAANTIGPNITITPPTAGTFTYSTQSAQGNPNCLEQGQGEITVTVENCGCSITSTASQTTFCQESSSPFSIEAIMTEVGTISWTGPAGFTATGALVNNITPPTTPGAYQYIGTGQTEVGACTTIVNITVNPTPAGIIAAPQTITCTRTTIPLTITTTNTATITWSNQGQTIGNGNTINVTDPGTYSAELTSEFGCQLTMTQITISDTVSPIFNINNPETITCINTQSTIQALNPAQVYNYNWTGPNIIGADNNSQVTAGSIGPYTVTATNPINGCLTTRTATVINDLTTPIIVGPQTTSLNCGQPNISVTLTLTPANSTINWTGPNTFTANQRTITIVDAGNFQAEVTHPETGCTATHQVFVTSDFINPVSFFNADILEECTPFTSTLNAQAQNNNYIYSWLINGSLHPTTGPTVAVDIANDNCATIELTVLNRLNGCISTTSIPNYICGLITPTAGINATPPYLMSFDNPIVSLTSTSINNTGHHWILPGGFTNQREQIAYDFSIHNTGQWFTIVANNNNRCFDTTSYFLEYHEDVLLFIPNAFTPDGDSKNNDFKAIISGDFDDQSFNFYIFNRWGEMIWESHDHSVGWNGNYNGTLVQSGVYTWTLDFKRKVNDERKTLSGSVTVLK